MSYKRALEVGTVMNIPMILMLNFFITTNLFTPQKKKKKKKILY